MRGGLVGCAEGAGSKLLLPAEDFPDILLSWSDFLKLRPFLGGGLGSYELL